MKNETLLSLIERCRIADGVELIAGTAYLFDQRFRIPVINSHDCIERYEIIILLYHNHKAGAILRCGDADVHWTVKERYQGKHILSDFLRSGVLKSVWPTNIQTDLSGIESRADYQKKKHLAELAGLRITNIDFLEYIWNHK